MTIYIASAETRWARETKAALELAGYQIASTWHDYRDIASSEAGLFNAITVNCEEISKADALIVLSRGPEYLCKGGKHVEAGIALGMGKRVLVLGERENRMYWHPRVTTYATMTDLLSGLRGSGE